MSIIDIVLYIVSPVVVVSIIVILLIIKNKKKTSKVEVESLLVLFKKDNIEKIDLIRNKIVVFFIDVTMFDHEGLKQLGASGINIIGDKVKFYFEDDKTTKLIYDKLKQRTN